MWKLWCVFHVALIVSLRKFGGKFDINACLTWRLMIVTAGSTMNLELNNVQLFFCYWLHSIGQMIVLMVKGFKFWEHPHHSTLSLILLFTHWMSQWYDLRMGCDPSHFLLITIQCSSLHCECSLVKRATDNCARKMQHKQHGVHISTEMQRQRDFHLFPLFLLHSLAFTDSYTFSETRAPNDEWKASQCLVSDYFEFFRCIPFQCIITYFRKTSNRIGRIATSVSPAV